VQGKSLERQREPSDVRFWHLADILCTRSYVRFWGVKRSFLICVPSDARPSLAGPL